MKTVKTCRTDLPVDVWNRLDAEARALNIPIGRHLRNLIVKRDTKKYPSGASPSTTQQREESS